MCWSCVYPVSKISTFVAMNYPSVLIEEAVNELSKFPNIVMNIVMYINK